MVRRRIIASLLALAACAPPPPVAATPPNSDGPGDASEGEAPAPSDDGRAGCPRVADAESAGALTAAEIDEASGIVQSTRNPGVYWIHNDSGDSARAFAVAPNGELVATLTFDTTAPVDVEDIAIEDVSAEASYLYLADIGDNAAARASLTIHRVAEPKLDGTTAIAATSEKMRVRYADGPQDAETLLFDPETRELVIVTKTFGVAAVHRVGPFVAGGDATTEKIASIDVALATGGEIARDGRRIGVRNYGRGYLWTRAPGEALAAALARPPCDLPLATERQGESFAFLADGSGYVTVSEGRGAKLHVSRFE